jgi:hypothetical protein
MAGVSLEVSEVMRAAAGGGAGNEVRKAGLVVGLCLSRLSAVIHPGDFVVAIIVLAWICSSEL